MSRVREGSRHRMRGGFRLRPTVAAWLAATCLAASLVAFGYANGGVPPSVSSAPAVGPVEAGAPTPGDGATDGQASGEGAADGGPANGQLVEVTPEGELELLSRLLPPGEITGAFKQDPPGVGVLLRFTRGTVHSYLTLSMSKSVPQLSQVGCDDTGKADRCTILADGSAVRLTGEATCESQLRSTVQRLDGVEVTMGVSLCSYVSFPPYTPDRDAWGSTGGGILKPAEVELIMADDQWSTTTRPELIEAGRRHYGTLPRVSPRVSGKVGG